MSVNPNADTLAFLAWARVWSPLPSDSERSEAWSALALPAPYEQHRTAFWSAFHAGQPSARASLLLHSALGLEGASVRRDWMRAIAHLRLSWNEGVLPPDHLGAGCEVYACAIAADEPVLIEELRSRYLLPWCQAASTQLTGAAEPIRGLPARFAADLHAVASC